MQAVILAAGKGTRMGTLTKDIPKPLLQVQGTPIIEWTLRNLPDVVTSIVVVIGYQGDKIKSHIGPRYLGKPVTYIEQQTQNGTGGALLTAQVLLEKRFIVLMGDDIYTRTSIEQACKHEYSMTVCELQKQRGLRSVIKTAGGYLSGFSENTDEVTTCLVNTGLYSLTDAYFSYPQEKLAASSELSIPDTLLGLRGEINTVVLETDHWIHCNTPEDLADAGEYLNTHKELFI